MNTLNRSFVAGLLSIATLIAQFSPVANADESRESVLNLYQTNGFECLDISHTVNSDTLEEYTDLASLNETDKVHVCMKTDFQQQKIPGNKYVFVFDNKDQMKAVNRISSIFD